MVGEVAAPARNISGTRAVSVPANTSGSISTAMPATPARKRRTGPPRQATTPNASPDTADPAACSPSTTPASEPWPTDSVNATVTSSREPNTAPVHRKVRAMTWMPGCRSGAVERPSADAGAAARTGGSVRRRPAKSSVPVRVSAKEQTLPAQGAAEVARATARTGPRTKHTSSSTCSKELARCMATASPSWISAHRARAIAPTFGAVVDRTLAAISAHAGARSTAHTTSTPVQADDHTAAGTATRACPNRSTSRPSHGIVTSVVISEAKVTRPASA